MESLVFFGKGGIGKSTIASNLSVLYALAGRKVLHVGCDPKHDSTLALAAGGSVRTFIERVVSEGKPGGWRHLIVRGRFGIDLVEAGGPEPGVGCAGRGISLMLETFKETRLLEEGAYDIVSFDILGDVVCGGFATPLRQGFGRKVFIVVSEELMSLYAANNIAKAVRHYSPNGVVLGGLIANVRDPQADPAVLERFAGLIGTRVLATIPRDPAVRQAEYLRKPLVEHAPRAPATMALMALAVEALRIKPENLPLPTPLDDDEFYARSLRRFEAEACTAAAGRR